MNDADRFRLLGTYRTPRFRYGRRRVALHGDLGQFAFGVFVVRVVGEEVL